MKTVPSALRRSTLLLLGLLGTAVPAGAQVPGMGIPERHLIRIGFGGGVSVPTSDVGDVLENGVNGQAFLLIDTGFLPPFRLNLGYQRFDLQDALGGGLQGDTRILSGVAALNLRLFTLGPVSPYVVAGLGAFDVREQIEAGTAAQGAAESTLEFGIDGGAGLAFKLGRLEAFIEGRVQNIYTDAGAIDASSIRAIPVSFGIVF